MNTKTGRDYQKEIDAWGKHNFTYIDRVGFGMVEELGEYCRAHMKARQGIRKHALKGSALDPVWRQRAYTQEQSDRLKADLKDAIGDGLIFTLHWTEANETFVSFEEARMHCNRYVDVHEFEAVSMLLTALAKVFELQTFDAESEEEFRPAAQRTFNNFALCAKLHGWDWEEILEETWETVRQRDWIKFPTDGKTK